MSAESPLLKFLGATDPFEVLPKTESALRAECAELSDAQLRTPESKDKWSVIEVVQHLADCEITFGYRFRAVLSEDAPQLGALDADAWAAGLRYRECSIGDGLDEFAAGRRANLRLLNRTSSEERALRYGLHAERGRESLDTIIRTYAGHDLCHLAQVRRIKRSLGLS